MRFSLIMGTLGRYEEVENFFRTMTQSTFQDFEIIVVDQNKTDDLVKLCETYADRLTINHLRIERRGLSIARNFGLLAAEGEIFAFPDDDCEYPEHLLETIDRVFRNQSDLDGLTAISRDKATGKVSNGRFSPKGGPLSAMTAWQRHISYTIFLRKQVCNRVGGFDELFGAGAKWAGGEESDYLLRALYNGFQIVYRPDIFVYHPYHVRVFDTDATNHAYVCGIGFGALAKKHMLAYRTLSQLPEATSRLVRSLSGCIIYAPVDKERSRYYGGHVRGWFYGFVHYSPKTELDMGTESIMRKG